MESLIFNFAGNLLKKLSSLAFQQVALAWGLESDLKRLEHTLANVKAVLLDAEEKQTQNQEIRVWLSQLKDAFYDAEDVLDEFECETLRRKIGAHRGRRMKVNRFFSLSKYSIAFRLRLGPKIKGIRDRLDDIAADRAKLHLTLQVEDKDIVVNEREMTHSFVNPLDVIGRDVDKENIIDLLLCHELDRNMSVISIVGIGGLGKTTLAKLVFNDQRVADHFQLKLWVCVSEDFDLKQLIIKIVKSATDENHSDLDPDQLQRFLRANLVGKKYLLVLDDVWNEDQDKWMKLRNLLNGGANGSRIIVTTRSSLTASIMGTSSPYVLEGLSRDDCLTLFMKRALRKEEERETYPNLVQIGNEIVGKCQGVPLAVTTLGSLLYSKTEEREWLFVRDNDIWKFNQKKDGILPALR